MPNGKAAPLGRLKLDVVIEHGGGDNHDIGAVVFAGARDVFGRMADMHGYAGIAKLLGIAAIADIRPGDDQALVVRHFGDAAHANAADAYEMNRGNFVVHA